MDVKIEIDDKMPNDLIKLYCNKSTTEIEEIKKIILDYYSKKQNLIFYKDNIEYYINISEILFFETDKNYITAHTKDDVYKVKFKLYELENILDEYFVRVSKSTIINITKIFSITKNLTSSSLVEFKDSYKKAYISRRYYKYLKLKIEEMRV